MNSRFENEEKNDKPWHYQIVLIPMKSLQNLLHRILWRDYGEQPTEPAYKNDKQDPLITHIANGTCFKYIPVTVKVHNDYALGLVRTHNSPLEDTTELKFAPLYHYQWPKCYSKPRD